MLRCHIQSTQNVSVEVENKNKWHTRVKYVEKGVKSMKKSKSASGNFL